MYIPPKKNNTDKEVVGKTLWQQLRGRYRLDAILFYGTIFGILVSMLIWSYL